MASRDLREYEMNGRSVEWSGRRSRCGDNAEKGLIFGLGETFFGEVADGDTAMSYV
jgi:hypothetical protein